jgi:hypothetical protein
MLLLFCCIHGRGRRGKRIEFFCEITLFSLYFLGITFFRKITVGMMLLEGRREGGWQNCARRARSASLRTVLQVGLYLSFIYTHTVHIPRSSSITRQKKEREKKEMEEGIA